MISDFFFPWSQLNFFFLIFDQQKNLTNLSVYFKDAKYFEYSKIEESYCTCEHLLDQIQTIDSSIKISLYQEY